MPHWLLRILRMRPQLSAAALVAALAHGGEPPANQVKQDDLIETFCTRTAGRQELGQACAELRDLKSRAPALKDEDIIFIRSYIAKRRLGDLDSVTASAQKAVLEAAWLSQISTKSTGTKPSAFVSMDKTKLKGMLETIRLASPGERKLEPNLLLAVVDALCQNQQVEDAGIVLDLVSSEPDRAQADLRRGILRMKQNPPDEAGARAAFRNALKRDAVASLPAYASKDAKTLELFNEAKNELKHPVAIDVPANPPATQGGTATQTGPVTTTTTPTQNLPWKNGQQLAGLATGVAGLALLLGGTGTGVAAFSTKIREDQAAASGDQGMYNSLRQTASTQSTVADVLSSVGGLVLATGACVYWFGPGGAGNTQPDNAGTPSGTSASVGVGVQKGQVSLTVDGHF